jgi:peptidoglycan/LPS O-acetylase OafA/YrhL
MIGSAMYFARKHIPWMVPLPACILIVALYAYWALFLGNSSAFGWREPNLAAFYANIFLVLPVTAAVIFSRVPEWFESFDRKLGELSYGIYINHFFVALVLLSIAGAANQPLFGRVNNTYFGLWCILASVMLAWVSYNLVETPINALRARVRRVSKAT